MIKYVTGLLLGIVLGVLAVPEYAAQQVSELMLSAGIRGILNFAPICLKAPEGAG